ncbi:MAG: hypothetical protein Q7T57_02880 [Dehalococcoidales bacterium]|nr:hypothetical protein [Dehalococcoidales bacterium]
MIANPFSYQKSVHLLKWLIWIPMKLLLLVCMLTTFLGTALACNDNSGDTSSPVRFFPVQVEGSGLEALLPGILKLDNGHLRIKYFDNNYLIIWPPGYSWRIKDEKIQIINEKNQHCATVGDNILVGGGETKSITEVEKCIGQKLPDNCEGPYWIMNDVVDNN